MPPVKKGRRRAAALRLKRAQAEAEASAASGNADTASADRTGDGEDGGEAAAASATGGGKRRGRKKKTAASDNDNDGHSGGGGVTTAPSVADYAADLLKVTQQTQVTIQSLIFTTSFCSACSPHLYHPLIYSFHPPCCPLFPLLLTSSHILSPTLLLSVSPSPPSFFSFIQ